MAYISVFNISRGAGDAKSAAEIVSCAASQSVPQSGKDARLALRIANKNESGSAVVKVAAGDGPRAALGSMRVAVAAMSTAYIPLFDSARFKDLSTGDITVTLEGTDGDALAAAELANVQIEAVQM